MRYKCAKCLKEAPIVRHDETVKGFVCDKCYFSKDKQKK